MASCTLYQNFATPVANKSLIVLAKSIAANTYKEPVEEIRQLLAQGQAEAAQTKKQQLPAFTPSATFKEKRLLTHIDQYSGFLHLDFDKITQEQMEKAFTTICNIPYTFLCFRSPSGHGLKVFVEVNTTQEQHSLAYSQVQQHYETAIGLKADVKCKDITRLCFVSYDPTLYKNLNHQKFIVNTDPKDQQTQRDSTTASTGANTDLAALFQKQVVFTNLKAQYASGNRNSYIYLLASNCNRVGISQEDTGQLCLLEFDLPAKELIATIQSAYEHHSAEFAKFAAFANREKKQQTTSKVAEDEDPEEDYLKTTPTLPDAVFQTLPDILKEGASAFTDRRKRDVFFTGAISILSGCLPQVSGIYFHERVYPHLYTFIIAPAASGKGVLKNAKRLADKYHQQVLAASREAQKRYDGELIDYKELLRNKNKKEAPPEQPNEPPFKIVFIPADSSQSRMVDHLQKNGGQGIICETEADTMSGNKKQDWGDYSTILRSAFHHEKVAITRKTNNEYIEIDEPRLAVALSGTPAQAPRLISSAEDGLFSRFLFYAFKNAIEWQDPSPRSQTVVYNDHFDALASTVLRVVEMLNQSPTVVELTSDQWDILNGTFRSMLADVTIFTSEEAAGIVFRLGLITFRMCMIFTALRKVENGDSSQTINCSDGDFTNAVLIAQTYLEHSILMFNNLPKQNELSAFEGGDNKRKFFTALPAQFTRKEAIELGKSFELGIRLVDGLLSASVEKTLRKIKAGVYAKM